MFHVSIFDPVGQCVNDGDPDTVRNVSAYIADMRNLLPGYTVYATVVPHTCSWQATEIRLSDCSAGCKVMACGVCNTTGIDHRRIYGCRNVQAR